MQFHDITIVIGSAVSRRRTHDTASLLPAAVEVFRDLLEQHGDDFRARLPVRGLEHVELKWTREGSGALTTFWSRHFPVSTSALAPGLDAAADRAVLESLQELVMRFHGDLPAEPGFDLLAIAERPLLATLPIPVPTAAISPDMGLIADAETCLAAAFFLGILGG
jgi:hypothetical protein